MSSKHTSEENVYTDTFESMSFCSENVDISSKEQKDLSNSYSQSIDKPTTPSSASTHHSDSSAASQTLKSAENKSYDYDEDSISKREDDDEYPSSYSDTQSYRSELSFVDDSQDTTSDQYSYSETFESSVIEPQTHSATTRSAPPRTLDTLKEESDFEESVTTQRDGTSSFERSYGTKTSYEDTFEQEPAESFSFRHRAEDIREISEAELTAAIVQEEKLEFVSQMCKRLREKKNVLPKKPEKTETQEDPQVKSYCRKKIKQLNNGMLKKKDILREVERSYRKKTVYPVPVETYGLNPAVIEKLKLKNLIDRMKRMSEMKIHDVKTCKRCRKHERMLDEAASRRCFLTHYSSKLRSENIDERVEEHLLKMNSISMIGEIVAQHPKSCLPSEELLEEYQRQISQRKKKLLNESLAPVKTVFPL